MQTSYRVIAFGQETYGFFQQPLYHSTYANALKSYLSFYRSPEHDGAVLIEVQHETWQVIEEFGTEGYSVIYNALGVFRVGKTPKLVLV